MSKKCEDSQVFGLGMVLSSRVQLSYYVGRLSKLVQMKGTFYPKLVKVFYTPFIEYFNIDVSNKILDFTKASSEITERHLKKLGMRFIDDEWIMVGEPAAGNFD